MKIYGFGDDRATCYRFDVLKASDDWSSSRQSTARKIGGSDGAFDYSGTTNNPVQPLTVSKTFDLPAYHQFRRADTWATIETGVDHVYFLLGGGGGEIEAVKVGDLIAVSNSILTIESIESSTDAITVETAAETPAAPYCLYDVIRQSAFDYDALDMGIDLLRRFTIARGKSKLWAQLRDGTYVWTWAKCTSFNAAEKISTRMSIPISLEFFCRDGLWYSETLKQHVFTSETSYNAVNAGNYRAALACDVLAGGSAVSVVALQAGTNTITWTGTLAANKHLLISTNPNAVKNDGVGAYSGIALLGTATKYDPWLYLNANGSTAIANSSLSDPLESVTFSWYDTYLL